MSVNIGLVSPDMAWGFGVIAPDGPWGIGDFEVNDWDDFRGLDGCNCGLGAAPAAAAATPPPKEHKFPWGTVVGAGIGLTVGVGAALLARKLLRKRS